MQVKSIRNSRTKSPLSSHNSQNALNRVHFIGIGGIGMSSLARWFLAQNWLVTGSDAIKSSITQELVKDGIIVKIGHNKANIPLKTDLIVITSAIPDDNVELKQAISMGIKIQKYAEALGDQTKKYQTISIAGSHGKSSTTAMVASIFIEAKMDPTVVIGTKLNGWNFRNGKSKWLIIEADEYKGAFWNYHSHSAIITNIDLEHVDFYKNIQAVKKSFLKFLKLVSKDGHIILNGDNSNILSIIPLLKNKKIITFSLQDKIIINKIKKVIKVPGQHNLMNALSVWKLAKTLGIKEEIIEKALSKYKGVWRRLEYKGIGINGLKIFDDYAHHSTEIRASLQAMREKFPNKKIIVCFEPHQQRRLTALYKDFVLSFKDADYVFIADTYNPKGRDEISETKNAKTLARDINKLNNNPLFSKAAYISNVKNIRKYLLKMKLNKNNILIMMGAGGISNITPLLMKNN